jgi:hypothetical protein
VHRLRGIEAPQPCTGDCFDRRLDLVAGADAEAARRSLADAERAIALTGDVIRRLALETPGPGAARDAYAALQRDARAALRGLGPWAPLAAAPLPAKRVTAWECESCGRIEAPRPCLGVCIRRPAEMCAADEYEAVRVRAEAACERAVRCVALVRRLARVTPRAGGWERTYRALQAEAVRASGTPTRATG